MDHSGDGRIQIDELKSAYLSFKEEVLDKDTLKKIIKNANLDGKLDENNQPYIDFRDFLMASADLTKESLLKLCSNAYLLMFNNHTQTIDKQDLIEMLCQEQNVKQTHIDPILT